MNFGTIFGRGAPWLLIVCDPADGKSAGRLW
jgi:hypothetical protein